MSDWPEAHDFDLAEAQPWDRQRDEPTNQYAAFRIYRDLPPYQRTLGAVSQQIDVNESTTRRWAEQWSWRLRVEEWDDACHRIEDGERLEAIRSMHSAHRRAGRAIFSKAIQAMTLLRPEEMPPSVIARLLDLGAKLERSTLVVSVEELQGVEEYVDTEDPWERIAAELDPHNSAAELPE